MMKKLYEKSELAFALVWIGIYCVGMSIFDEISRNVGVESSATAVFGVAASLFLYFWLKQQGKLERFGLYKPTVPAKAFLFYIPLIVITLQNVWGGVEMHYDAVGTVCFIVKMLCVGFLEELIFRGFLFKAMSRDSIKWAVVVSSVTFGLGHIINLLNGSGMGVAENLVQIFFAVLIGFLYVIIFWRGGSLWPCIISHGVLNSLSAFSASDESMVRVVILCVLVVAYTLVLLKTLARGMGKKIIKTSGNCSFVWYNILLIVILLGSIAFSIVDKYKEIISWPVNYENIIGASSQIITAIVSLVVSIIGIAIFLQNEEFFGVKITKLYALRVTKHYSILKIIVTSILLCALNLTLYMCGLTVGAIGTLVVALLFLLKVVHTEIPIMAKEEKALLQILKDNLIICYIKKLEASKDLKEALKYLLYRKNFKELYLAFKDEADTKYNQYLLFKLLEFQHDLAFELKSNYEESEQRIVGSSLLDNVLDVVFRHVEVADDVYDEISKNKHLLTRVLFRLHELPASREMLLHGVSRMFRYLSYSAKNSKLEDQLVSSVLIILISETVKAKDFSIIKVIRQELSSSSWGLRHASADLDVFVVTSLYLYYLYYSDSDVPADLKEEVLSFINEGGMIERNTRITSWKALFAEAANEFHVDYHNFLSLVLAHSHNMEYWLHGTGGKFVVLEPGYLTRWYLTHLFNTRFFREYDYSLLLKESEELKHHLKSFADSCFDENKQFTPSEEMIRIVNFFGDAAHAFAFFRIAEDRYHTFFEFVNQLKVDELMHDTDLALGIDTTSFSKKIRNGMETAIRSEWGYDPSIKITNAERYFSVFLELFPEACNFEDSIVECCEGSLLSDIEKSIQKTILYKDDRFEDGIHSMLHKNLKYITGSTKSTIPNFYINDEAIKQLFYNVCNPLEEIKSRLLGVLAVVTENGFRFNFNIDKVEFRDLTEEELARQVSKYQRADGQYVFRGAFLPQEEITKIIKDKFTILTIVARHQVVSSQDSVFELKPYSTGPEDE